jgi:phosphatidylglycerol:prolipoprotein diacylglycerol transferase
VADIAAPCIMLGLALGRVGCFFNGCCYGQPTDGALGVQFPGHPGPVHPTQIYEAAGALLLAAALYALLRWRGRGRGAVFGWMLVGYGVLRTLIEIYRADPRGSIGPLSTSQIISIPLIAIGAVVIARAARPAVNPDTASGQPTTPA